MTVRLDALPELTQAWYTLEQLAATHGVQIGIADDGGFRTQADTTRDVGYRDTEYAAYVQTQKAAGRPVQSENVWRPIAPYGSSYHNYGAARDFTIVIKPSSMTTDAAMALVRSLAPAAGLRAIYPGTNDPPHLELPISLDDAAQRWSDYQAGTGPYATDDASGASDGASSATDDASSASGDGGDAGTGDASSGVSTIVTVALIAVVGLGIVALRRAAAG